MNCFFCGRITTVRKITLPVLGITLLCSLGCRGGVGFVSVHTVDADDGVQTPRRPISGHFDSVLQRKDRGVFTFTAYQKSSGRRRFNTYHRAYKKDHPFVTAQLTVRIDPDAGLVDEPRLLFQQGQRILTDGRLVGEVTITPRGKSLAIRGEELLWDVDDRRATLAGANVQRLTFELTVNNVTSVRHPPAETSHSIVKRQETGNQ